MVVLDLAQNFWSELVARPSGPLALRFLLQPLMAASFAIRDGVKDARSGRSPYFWTVLSKPDERRARLQEGLRSTRNILVIALILDVIYQLIQFRTVYPLQAIVIAFVLAFIPYLLIRGPTARLARWRTNRLQRS